MQLLIDYAEARAPLATRNLEASMLWKVGVWARFIANDRRPRALDWMREKTKSSAPRDESETEPEAESPQVAFSFQNDPAPAGEAEPGTIQQETIDEVAARYLEQLDELTPEQRPPANGGVKDPPAAESEPVPADVYIPPGAPADPPEPPIEDLENAGTPPETPKPGRRRRRHITSWDVPPPDPPAPPDIPIEDEPA